MKGLQRMLIIAVQCAYVRYVSYMIIMCYNFIMGHPYVYIPCILHKALVIVIIQNKEWSCKKKEVECPTPLCNPDQVITIGCCLRRSN